MLDKRIAAPSATMSESDGERSPDGPPAARKPSTSHLPVHTPDHVAAAASLANLASPSRLTRATLSPARPSAGLGAPQFERGASSLSTASQQESGPASAETKQSDGEERRPVSTDGRAQAPPPSVTFNLAEFPPVDSSSLRARTNDDEGDEDDQARLPKTTRPPGVDFLTQRLRSAIGQDLLLDQDNDEEGEDDHLDDQQMRSIHVERPSNVQRTSSNGEAAERSGSSQQAESSTKPDGGWTWSSWATIPAGLRVDRSLQALQIGGKKADTPAQHGVANEPSTPVDGKKDESPLTLNGIGGTMTKYAAALDVRKWFAESDGEASTSQTVAQDSDAAAAAVKTSTADSAIGPAANPTKKSSNPSPYHGMPAGSYPSSSVRKKKNKERKRVSELGKEPQKAVEKERKDPGSQAVEHEIKEESLGGDGFARHEYLVLSTAGKPVYWSRVSKARIERAKVHRLRRRQQQEAFEQGRAEGRDVKREMSETEKREEDIHKEEQSIQDEEDQLEATRVGLLQAVISNFAETDKAKLHATAKEVLELPEQGRVCFLLRPPLYLVAVSRWDDAESTLRNHLDYLYQAIISLVSATKLNRLFDRAANFDLKRLLQGTDNILDALLIRMQDETIAMRGALQPLRLDATVRHEVGAALLPMRNKQSRRPQDALYAILLTRKGIVTLARRRKIGINPVDCHLLVNTVLATKALKEGGTQTWVPICLPKFAPQGFVYAHVSFLDHDALSANGSTAPPTKQLDRRPEIGLVLITGNPDGFDEMSAWREQIVERLREANLMALIPQIASTVDDVEEDEEDGSQRTPSGLVAKSQQSAALPTIAATYSADELGLAGLRHFCFKWRSNVQTTSPKFEAPYTPGSQNHRRLLHLYDLAYDFVVRESKNDAAKSQASHQSSVNASPSQSDVETLGGTDARMSRKGTGDSSSQSSLADTKRTGRSAALAAAAPPSRSASPPIVARSVLSGKAPERQGQGSSRDGAGSTLSASTAGMAASASNMLVDAIRGGAAATSAKKPSTMHVLRTQSETVLAWSSQPFEVYVTASPHISRASLISMAKGVVKWIKQEEHRLFIVSAPVF